jgi:hypothetical protein
MWSSIGTNEGEESMQIRRGYTIAAFGFTAFLVFALLLGGTWRSVSADEATGSPTSGADMGDCVTALGIGNEGDACLNVIHASPDAPAVDVYLDGTKALGDLAFGKTSGWVAVPAGEHQVQVTAAGAEIATAVIDAKVTLEAGAAYEVAATGLLAQIAPQVYQANLSEIGDEGEAIARIRVVHASPDAPAVDIAVKGGDVLISNLAFPDASDYLVVPAGSYDLEVRVAGTTDVALDLPGVVLDAGMVYSVYAIGQVGDGSLTVLPVTATATAPAMATPAA